MKANAPARPCGRTTRAGRAHGRAHGQAIVVGLVALASVALAVVTVTLAACSGGSPAPAPTVTITVAPSSSPSRSPSPSATATGKPTAQLVIAVASGPKPTASASSARPASEAARRSRRRTRQRSRLGARRSTARLPASGELHELHQDALGVQRAAEAAVPGRRRCLAGHHRQLRLGRGDTAHRVVLSGRRDDLPHERHAVRARHRQELRRGGQGQRRERPEGRRAYRRRPTACTWPSSPTAASRAA